MFLNAGTVIILLESCGRKQSLKTETFEVALSVDGLVELVYELVNSFCMLYIVSTITMTSADQTA